VLPLIYYDFYVAHLATGKAVAVRDTSGLVALEVGPGRHLIEVREQLTPIYWIGLTISLLTMPWPLLRRLIGPRPAAADGSESKPRRGSQSPSWWPEVMNWRRRSVLR
jgi:hypothetical protein